MQFKCRKLAKPRPPGKPKPPGYKPPPRKPSTKPKINYALPAPVIQYVDPGEGVWFELKEKSGADYPGGDYDVLVVVSNKEEPNSCHAYTIPDTFRHMGFPDDRQANDGNVWAVVVTRSGQQVSRASKVVSMTEGPRKPL